MKNSSAVLNFLRVRKGVEIVHVLLGQVPKHAPIATYLASIPSPNGNTPRGPSCPLFHLARQAPYNPFVCLSFGRRALKNLAAATAAAATSLGKCSVVATVLGGVA